jgi:uncharacterized spore protein YtfJ
MSSPAPFESVADVIQRSLSIRHVYGEPIQHGAMTVIPVAKVAFGFGAGGGRGRGHGRAGAAADAAAGEATRQDAQGAGGGGGVRMTPVGVLEVGPEGTRFIRFNPVAPWLGAAAIGLALGWLIARRRG